MSELIDQISSLGMILACELIVALLITYIEATEVSAFSAAIKALANDNVI